MIFASLHVCTFNFQFFLISYLRTSSLFPRCNQSALAQDEKLVGLNILQDTQMKAWGSENSLDHRVTHMGDVIPPREFAAEIPYWSEANVT